MELDYKALAAGLASAVIVSFAVHATERARDMVHPHHMEAGSAPAARAGDADGAAAR
jgi:hypothetical protein